LSPSFLPPCGGIGDNKTGLFVKNYWLFTPSNIIVLWRKYFSEKCFSKSGMTMRNPKKNVKKGVEKGQVGTLEKTFQ